MAIRLIDASGKVLYVSDAGGLIRAYAGPWDARAVQAFAVRFGLSPEHLQRIAPAASRARAVAPARRASTPRSHVDRLMQARRLQQEARLIQAGFSLEAARRLAGSKP